MTISDRILAGEEMPVETFTDRLRQSLALGLAQRQRPGSAILAAILGSIPSKRDQWAEQLRADSLRLALQSKEAQRQLTELQMENARAAEMRAAAKHPYELQEMDRKAALDALMNPLRLREAEQLVQARGMQLDQAQRADEERKYAAAEKLANDRKAMLPAGQLEALMGRDAVRSIMDDTSLDDEAKRERIKSVLAAKRTHDIYQPKAAALAADIEKEMERLGKMTQGRGLGGDIAAGLAAGLNGGEDAGSLSALVGGTSRLSPEDRKRWDALGDLWRKAKLLATRPEFVSEQDYNDLANAWQSLGAVAEKAPVKDFGEYLKEKGLSVLPPGVLTEGARSVIGGPKGTVVAPESSAAGAASASQSLPLVSVNPKTGKVLILKDGRWQPVN